MLPDSVIIVLMNPAMRLYDLLFFILSCMPIARKLLPRVVNLKYIAFPPTGRFSDSPKNRNSERFYWAFEMILIALSLNYLFSIMPR